jgi:hypothetical protein
MIPQWERVDGLYVTFFSLVELEAASCQPGLMCLRSAELSSLKDNSIPSHEKMAQELGKNPIELGVLLACQMGLASSKVVLSSS